MSSAVAVIGMQWGDEGKGKIIDFLASNADVIIRSQGGNNAGHTVYYQNHKFALHLLPSGIFNPNTLNIMASGMVINLSALLTEIDKINDKKITNFNLVISDRAHVIMPYHLLLDQIIEILRKDQAIGTTKKGIGPAYMDKAARFGIRIGDLYNHEYLSNQLKLALSFYNPILEAFEFQKLAFDSIFQDYLSFGEKIKDYVCDTSRLINRLIKENKNILFEGAQGTMLCLDHGTYPYVTSSSPSAMSIALNTGIPAYNIKQVIGVTKAYSTRVGSGVFPTEIEGELASYIREKGKEFGTTTNRPRRIGYLDAVVIKHAARVNGTTGLAITLLDVLSEIKELKICVAYQYEGKIIDYIPANYAEYLKCKPIFQSYPGWDEDITQVKNYFDLPSNCKNYLLAIEKLTDTKVSIISLGPNREQTIILDKNIFKDVLKGGLA